MPGKRHKEKYIKCMCVYIMCVNTHTHIHIESILTTEYHIAIKYDDIGVYCLTA